MKVMVTGANGFIGHSLCDYLLNSGFKVRGVVRSVESADCLGLDDKHIVGELGSDVDWSNSLVSVDCVVHLAARVHVMDELEGDPIVEFRKINVGGTVSLARQAAEAGVKRFIYLSSIKVNGEFTQKGHPFTADELPAPFDPYAVSKWEAEQALMQISADTGLEIVIIRPPLVYGPSVKANFYRLMQILEKGVPLPFGAINNKRSLVALDNLVDFIIKCIEHPRAANQIFLVSDGKDLSTTELLRHSSRALGKTAHLISVPVWLLNIGLKVIGKSDTYQRLCGSLQVDIRKSQELLGWSPPVSVNTGLKKTADWFNSVK